MRQSGAKLAVAIVIALVAGLITLEAPALAHAHHHHHHHHHSGGGGGGGGAPAAAPSLCAATPQTIVLTLQGAGGTSAACHGLAPFEAVTVDSLLLRGNCGAVTFDGVTPPVVLTSDGAGNLSFGIAGFNCLAGSYSVQLVGPISTAEFPVAMSF